MYELKNTLQSTYRAEDYAYLVKRIALHIMARMPASVQLEDLMQSGMIGLLEAIQKFDDSKGASFETYAGIRIRGAIVDEMRRGDWVPRSVHRNKRAISEAIEGLEKRLGRDARDTEIADALGVTLDDYYSMAHDCMSARLFSLEESLEGDDEHSPGEIKANDGAEPAAQVSDDALRSALAAQIKHLPEREQLVLSLYYEQELNLKEIGMVLGVSESRVSQIHSQAAARLRSRLKGW
ncbi:RNA polymerase sigma factor FliA [Agaribacterium haliotis]|uniref:RNA polymerase sigma factor FliA n=1 Tax=Agaribacterium haliotis TaxID=2013869 RepID=UPI000BB52D3A|nr:RNA polymerase sigma factor FliA [Agaribacterium haliotis]